MIAISRSFVLVLISVLVTACGGSSSSDKAPTAIANASSTAVYVGEVVTLSGSDSTPSSSLTYIWSLIGQPDESEAEITDNTSIEATFIPDYPGEYVFSLSVNDGSKSSEDTTASRINLIVSTEYPIAVLDDRIEWILGTVQLDGSNSLPPTNKDASDLQYKWTLTQVPESSTSEFDDATVLYPRFTADLEGEYKAELVVFYNDKSSKAAEIAINITEGNAAPNAAIEGSLFITVNRGDTVTLDASASTDANGDELQYFWRFSRLAKGSEAELSSTSAETTSFVADAVDSNYYDYVIELKVFDGIAVHKMLPNINVKVEVPEGDENNAPVITPSSGTHELEIGEEAKVSSYAYDIDGTKLTYTYAFIDHPEGYDPDADESTDFETSGRFTPSVAGEYQIEITASDGELTDTTSVTYTAMLGANHSPKAVATVTDGNTTSMVGTTVTLDGEGSSDPDDNRLTYNWSLIQQPHNSTTTIENSDTALPTLYMDQAGPYLVQLEVTDEHGTSDSTPALMELFAKSENHAPITRMDYYALYDNEQPFAIQNEKYTSTNGDHGSHEIRKDRMTLTANTYDQDSDGLTHRWTMISDEPEGNVMEEPVDVCYNGTGWIPAYETVDDYVERVTSYREWTCAVINIAPTVPGSYVFEYEVYDGSEYAGPYTVAVEAVLKENYPTLLVEYVYQKSLVGNFDSIHYRQVSFPYNMNAGLVTSISRGNTAEENDILYGQSAIRLTATDKGYTFINVVNASEDLSHIPTIMDVTNDIEITEGYVLEKGDSIEVQMRIPFGIDTTEVSDYFEAQNILRNANISASFDIAEREGWTVTMESY